MHTFVCLLLMVRHSLHDYENCKCLLCIMLKFDVLTALAVKVVFTWDVTACSMVDMYQCFGAMCHFECATYMAPRSR
jgi:hypothetical protein